MRPVLLSLILLAASRMAVAQDALVESRVSVCVFPGFCKTERFAGNGVYVAHNGDNSASMVATAAHVIDGGEAQSTVQSIRVDGQPATILGRWNDGQIDLALVRVSGPASALARHAVEIPAAGSRIRLLGQHNGNIEQHDGFLRDPERRRGNYGGHAGLSGAGVYNEAGELLGVHNRKVTDAAGNWYRAFTSLRRLDEFVSHYAPDMQTARMLGQPAQIPTGSVRKYDRTAPPEDGTEPGTITADAGGNVEPPKAGDGLPATDSGTDGAGSLPAKAKDLAKDVAGAAVDGAVATATNPAGWWSGAATGGLSTAAIFGISAGLAFIRRRQKRRSGDAGADPGKSSSEPSIVADVAKTAVEAAMSGNPKLAVLESIPGILERLNDLHGIVAQDKQDGRPPAEPVVAEIAGLEGLQQQLAALAAKVDSEHDANAIADRVISSMKEIRTGSVVGDDGRTVDDTLWKSAVRKLIAGAPELKILGGPEAGKAAERWVYQQIAKAAGNAL